MILIAHFRVALNLIMKVCKAFIMKISFPSYVNKTSFHMKSFALSLALITRFTAIRKWPIVIKFGELLLSPRIFNGLRSVYQTLEGVLPDLVSLDWQTIASPKLVHFR